MKHLLVAAALTAVLPLSAMAGHMHKDKWSMMDMDSNGKVTMDEFKKYKGMWSGMWAGKKFKKMDMNSDGMISHKEWKTKMDMYKKDCDHKHSMKMDHKKDHMMGLKQPWRKDSMSTDWMMRTPETM